MAQDDEPAPSPPPTATATAHTTPPVSPPAASSEKASTPSTTSSDAAPLRPDLVQSAVSFLSSPSVQSADTAKKVAFLKKKGLNQAEIEEAFKKTGQTTMAASSNTAPLSPPSQSSATTSSSSAPASSHAPPAPLIPTRMAAPPAPPQIIYRPVPPPPKMPASSVLALAILLGMGTVGVTSCLVHIVKRVFMPVFASYAQFRQERYGLQRDVLDKINKLLQGKSNEEGAAQAEMEPEDKQARHEQEEAEDSSAAATLLDIEEKQQGLVDRLIRVHSQARDREQELRSKRATSLPALSGSLTNWKRSVEALEAESMNEMFEKEDHKMAKLVQTEIRSLKGALLNRRVYT
ncbi:peroxisomal membrane anchor protein conserved region-domain-containing protein [Syncephalastrum racemosum]|uniref:Peroxisomal membrane protein PEX14 n=1 Tax=Syncephalastrum racemosum TaxID=13706 RepID=A0A1X2HJJ1_SYNRA|nr:peroxisomal membrane anchor protein conserved region-domain-containing protein [Syncephalastrum racemosum]